jgi:protein-S-isoprenylcysteine O-methyltransferase Ste14
MQRPSSDTPERKYAAGWLSRIDRWIIFNPAQWPLRELISRTTALTVITVFLVLRIYHFDRFPQVFDDALRYYSTFRTPTGSVLYDINDIRLLWGIKLGVWIIETAIYLGYIAAYASRIRAVSIARGFLEVGFPVLVAAAPILLSFMPYSLPDWLPVSSPRHMTLYLLIMGLIVFGGTLNLIGLITLRRAFTIMSEARALITHGIFRYIRHPLYTGHLIMFFGSMLLRLHVLTVALYMLFAVGQYIRARIEERKLQRSFAEYADYKNRTGMFFPNMRIKTSR